MNMTANEMGGDLFQGILYTDNWLTRSCHHVTMPGPTNSHLQEVCTLSAQCHCFLTYLRWMDTFDPEKNALFLTYLYDITLS